MPKSNSVEARGRVLYFNGREIGDVHRGWFVPNDRGSKMGLVNAQVDPRGAVDYITDYLLREKVLTDTEWRVSRRQAATGRK